MSVVRTVTCKRNMLCTNAADDQQKGVHSKLTVPEWQELASSGNAPPLRFPIGTPVRCFVGSQVWPRGTVIAHDYREENWPAEQLSAPYQILLDDEWVQGGGNAIWAPADVDEMIRSAFRFGLGETAECRVGEEEWARCTVTGYHYRESEWPDWQYAPYQVRVDSVLPGCLDERAAALAAQGALIWLPRDNAEIIRTPSAERFERLTALAALASSGVVSGDELREKRKEIIMSDSPEDKAHERAAAFAEAAKERAMASTEGCSVHGDSCDGRHH
jgi:hypothetical protein